MSITIGKVTFEDYDPGLQEALKRAHHDRVRPTCNCRSPGVDMYIARLGDKYFLKRMPLSGSKHAMSCDSYEPPFDLSGSSPLKGTAIKEDIETGQTELRLDFSLSKSPGRKLNASAGTSKTSAKTDGQKLTLRGLLHYLWDEAGFNRWAPKMAGKRSWGVVRKYLLEVAVNKNTKHQNLSELLFIPEPFVLERKSDIVARRRRWLSDMSQAGSDSSVRLRIVVGALKEIERTRFGHRVRIKHLPDLAFAMNDDLYRRFYKRFAEEILLLETTEDASAIIIATFSLSQFKAPIIEEISMMLVDTQFIPFENDIEKDLNARVVAECRRALKPMRYNLDPALPLPMMIISDTPVVPTAIYLVTSKQSPEYREALDALVQTKDIASVLWDSEDTSTWLLPTANTKPLPPPSDLL